MRSVSWEENITINRFVVFLNKEKGEKITNIFESSTKESEKLQKDGKERTEKGRKQYYA